MTFNLYNGYRLVVITTDKGDALASLSKDDGKTILWTGLLTTLKNAMNTVARQRMN